MLFCTKEYLFFFLAVFSLYWAVPYARARTWILLAASYAFYAFWNNWLAALIVGTSTVDFLLAKRIEREDRPGPRKRLMAFSVLMNVCLLCYFKYMNFFLGSLEDALRACGAQVSLPTLSILLPIGISFYTFEAINYIVDVYRRRIPAEKRLDRFLLFILFFPHLIAGPIVRARDFLPQVARPKRWSWPRFTLGVSLFLLGMFKKLAIADRMALLVDPVFADTASFSTAANWLAAVGFAVQVFCDFSGYTDMALGSAHMLGYKLAPNFAMPFLARNLGEFWKRWHMSLSGWLRDYVFFPLGGSRGGTLFTMRNLVITMTLGGLWHGANWNYVLWGTSVGVLLCVHRLFAIGTARLPRVDRALQTEAGHALCVATTFMCFVMTLVVFRSPSLNASGTMFGRLFTDAAGKPCPLPMPSVWFTLTLLVVGHGIGLWLQANRFAWKRAFAGIPAPLLGVGFAALGTAAMLLAPGSSKSFIYFQF